jgi:hypothetical protein
MANGQPTPNAQATGFDFGFGKTPSPAPATSTGGGYNFGFSQSQSTSTEPAPWYSRAWQGVKQSVESNIVQPLRGAFSPADPKDAGEIAAQATGGQPGLIAYRVARAAVNDAAEKIHAPRGEYNAAIQQLVQAEASRAKGEWGGSVAHAVAAGFHALGMIPGNPIVGRVSELAEGAAPGGNLAGPVARDVTDLATMAALERVSRVGGGGEAPETTTISEQAPRALSLQGAGKSVQEGIEASRSALGEQLAQARQAVIDSASKQLSGKIVPMTFADDGPAATMGKKVLDEIGSASQLGLKDSTMSGVEELAKKFATGKDADGNLIQLSPEQVQGVDRSLNGEIAKVSRQVKAGSTSGQALGLLKQLKTAFDADSLDYFQNITPNDDLAGQMKDLSKQYADFMGETARGPAKRLLSTQEPEQIVKSLVSGGAGKQSAVESIVSNLPADKVPVLRDSVTQEIFRVNTVPGPDGLVDMVKAQKKFYSMGVAARSLYGDSYLAMKRFFDDAARLQEQSGRAGLPRRVLAWATGKLGATAGAVTAGPLGAAGGAAVGEAVGERVAAQPAVKGLAPRQPIPSSTPSAPARPGIGAALTAIPASTARPDAQSWLNSLPPEEQQRILQGIGRP